MLYCVLEIEKGPIHPPSWSIDPYRKVRGLGAVGVSDRFTLREVTLVSNLGFNLLSVSQLLDEGFEVRFKEGCSRVLDSRGDLVCRITPCDRVFLVDFSGTPLGPSHCLMAGPSCNNPVLV